MVGDDHLRIVPRLDAVHALQPLTPLVGVHPDKGDAGTAFRVLPLASDALDVGSCVLQLCSWSGSNDDQGLMRRVHDILEGIGIKFHACWETVLEKLRRGMRTRDRRKYGSVLTHSESALMSSGVRDEGR